MVFDLARARAETPGCQHVTHFNNAGSSLMPQPVLDAVVAHLQAEAFRGGYEAANAADSAIEQVYDGIAALLHCQREEIALIENATRAWDMAFYSIPFQPGDRILTAQVEYVSNYVALLQVARRTGASVEVIPSDASGQVDVAALEAMLDERVKLIAITHVPTNGGLVNPAEAIGAVARRAGILYLLDACQSAGQLPLDVEALGCDMLSATGRKYLRGPRGTGFLYVRRAVLEQLEPPFIDLQAATWVERNRYELRPDARRFENWESNIAAKLGLGVAVRYAQAWGLETIAERVSSLATQLRSRLAAIPTVTVHDLGVVQCGIVTFTVAGVAAQAVREALAAQRINVSVSKRSSTRLDMEARNLEAVVRASVHYYNSEDELVRLVAAVAAVAG
jgi:cysteine desulfurase / selenocysteine lyase